MTFRPYILYSLLVLTIFQACSKKSELPNSDDEQALVNVNGKILYKYEVDNIVPKGLNQTDSTLAAEAYIKMWIKNELIYEKALENLNDKEKIEALVNNYRQSLTIFTYQEQLLQERLSKNISDSELQTFYNENPDQFKLDNSIIKGFFLKVPLNAPQIDEMKKWYKQGDLKAIEQIEKLSLQNAVIFDYFNSQWVDFDDIMTNIPYQVTNQKQFLSSNKTFEVQDSSYIYLLNIKEYLLEGNQTPFDYSKGKIMDIIINRKREKFIKEFEENLYKAAIDNKQIKYYK